MSSVDVDRILEEARRLPPDERRRLREAFGRVNLAEVQLNDRAADLSWELRWIDEHRSEYAGQAVAARGDACSAAALTEKKFTRRRAAGDDQPFVTRVKPADELPFAGL